MMLCPLSVVAESLRLTRPLKKEPKVNANFEILSDIATPAETRLAAVKAKLIAESAIVDELHSQSAV
jgi:hypothetical protein